MFTSKKILDAARSEGENSEGRFGQKVFIDSVARRLKTNTRTLGPVLVDLHRRGEIELSRADMVAAMNPSLVRNSNVSHLNSEYHFIRAPFTKSHSQPNPRKQKMTSNSRYLKPLYRKNIDRKFTWTSRSNKDNIDNYNSFSVFTPEAQMLAEVAFGPHWTDYKPSAILRRIERADVMTKKRRKKTGRKTKKRGKSGKSGKRRSPAQHKKQGGKKTRKKASRKRQAKKGTQRQAIARVRQRRGPLMRGINVIPPMGRRRKKTGRRKKHHTVTAAAIINRAEAQSRHRGSKVHWICAGRTRTGCGGGKKGGHVVGDFRLR